MAGRTVFIIGLWCNTEVVDDIFFAKPLFIFWIKKLPGPVFCFMDLFRCFGVAFDAGFRYFGTGSKMSLQFLELSMISS